MTIYESVAVIAAGKVVRSKGTESPKNAWKSAFRESRGRDIDKTCPMNAFLGLCEAGAITGIPAGKYDASSPNPNGGYAIEALQLLQSDPMLAADKSRLWGRLSKKPETKNSQMDVVVSLWNEGLLRLSPRDEGNER